MMWVAVIFVYLGGFASVVALALLQHEWMAFFVLCVLGLLSIRASPLCRAVESVGDAGDDKDVEDDEDDEDDEESEEQTADSKQPGAVFFLSTPKAQSPKPSPPKPGSE